MTLRQRWATLRFFRPDTPKEVYLAAGVARRLNNEIGRDTVRYIAKKAGLSPQTILNILNGATWPDLRTIARLEVLFDYRLWGYEHRMPVEDIHFRYHEDGTFWILAGSYLAERDQQRQADETERSQSSPAATPACTFAAATT